MQDASYIKKIVDGESFEDLEKKLRGRIIELKLAYKREDYNYAKDLRKDIEGFIEDAKKAIKIPSHEIRLKKEEKKYSILINLGKIYGGSKNAYVLDKLLEKVQFNYTQLEEKILEPNQTGDYEYPPVTKSFKDSTDIKLKEKTYREHYSDYNKFGALIYNLTKKLKSVRKELLYERSKLLGKNHYQGKMLEKGYIEEFGKILSKAKESCIDLGEIENKYHSFRKDVVG